MAYTLTDYFFIPLVDIKIDIPRLKEEVYKHINPVDNDYGITCRAEDADQNPFDFRLYSGMRAIKDIAENPYTVSLNNGVVETDIVHWPKQLQGSYIQELGRQISATIGLATYRCRLSIFNKSRQTSTGIGFHYDKHTPYRVHIALETTNFSVWKYRKDPDSQSHSLHHPVMDHPVLMNTGDIQHDIYVPPGHQRMHLWYQFHSRPDLTVIHSLIDKYKLTKS